jgi:hypothetical protein
LGKAESTTSDLTALSSVESPWLSDPPEPLKQGGLMVRHAILNLVAFVCIAAAQDQQVVVPSFPNSTCPIMGKAISSKLFTETAYGRIYMCCKSCTKKIQNDVQTAYKTAYPTVKKVENALCPITGKAIGKDAVKVLLQGHELSVYCAECVDDAKANAQLVLFKASNPKAKDLTNKTCPVTSQPVERNAFCVINDVIVHLSSLDCVEEVRKAPKAVLAKANEIKAKEGKTPGENTRDAGRR